MFSTYINTVSVNEMVPDNALVYTVNSLVCSILIPDTVLKYMLAFALYHHFCIEIYVSLCIMSVNHIVLRYTTVLILIS